MSIRVKCPHCGKQPDKAIASSLDTCQPGDAFGSLTNCDHCGKGIEIAVHKSAVVQRRAKGYSDRELDEASAHG